MGLSFEFTGYLKPDFQGFYVGAGFGVYDAALTSRPEGKLENVNYVRAGNTLALGYRFGYGLSLEVRHLSIPVDPDFTISTVGAGVRFNF